MAGPWEQYQSKPASSDGPWSQYKSAEEAAPKVEPTRTVGEVVGDALDIRNMPKNAMAGLQKIDEYTGAPIRKFITEKLSGEELEKAPSGAEQAERLGATKTTYGEKFGVPSYLGGNIAPADIYGAALEVVQDPFVIGSAVKKGFQAVAKGAAPAIERMSAKTVTQAAQEQAGSASAEAAARSGAQFRGGGTEIEQSGKLFSIEPPKSLDELRNWKPSKGTGELPAKGRLQEVVQVLPDLEVKPLKYHYDMLENPKAMKAMKLEFENLPTSDAQRIAAYNQEMVLESGRKVQDTVKSLSPVEPRSLTEAGDDFISSVKEKYKAEKSELGPMFEQLKQSPPLDQTQTMDLAQAIGANSKIGQIMDIGEDGKLFLKENSPRTGISDTEHTVLSRVVKDMNQGMTFKELQDTREFLRKSVDPMNPGATAEINNVRSIMLDQMEQMAEKQGPSVGQTFKRYAVNERNRESIERVIGGRIESLDSMFAANPDRVVKKIFANPNYAKVVGDYVGPEKMQELIGSYVSNGVSKSFDPAKGFNPSSLKTWLKSQDQFLTRYAPDAKQRLEALADYGYFGKRYLDEVNPSGTAASLSKMLKPEGFINKIKNGEFVAAVTSETVGRAESALKQRQAVKSTNEMLGAAAGETVGSRIKSVAPSDKTISDAVKFQQGTASARALGGETRAAVASDDSSKKGPDKWANDGAKKLNQAGLSETVIESLRQTKQGRALLIEASDANPGSKRMESVLKRVRTASGGQ